MLSLTVRLFTCQLVLYLSWFPGYFLHFSLLWFAVFTPLSMTFPFVCCSDCFFLPLSFMFCDFGVLHFFLFSLSIFHIPHFLFALFHVMTFMSAILAIWWDIFIFHSCHMLMVSSSSFKPIHTCLGLGFVKSIFIFTLAIPVLDL